MSNVKTFEAGKTYQTRSICDHNCIIAVTIEKRTAKTVTAKVRGEVKTFRVAIYEGAEFIIEDKITRVVAYCGHISPDWRKSSEAAERLLIAAGVSCIFTTGG